MAEKNVASDTAKVGKMSHKPCYGNGGCSEWN